MALSAFGASTMSAGIRVAAEELHSFEIAFFRNALGIVALIPSIIKRGIVSTLRTQRLGLHAIRGVLNGLAMLAFFYALAITPLATVAALGFTAPLFATLLAILILGEKVGPRRWAGIFVGFLGTLIVVRPGLEAISFGSLLVLLASLLWAGALIAIKLLGRTENSLTTTFYASCFLTPITFAFAIFFWKWPSMEAFWILIFIAAAGTITQISLAEAFREADASTVLPLDFTKLIWASLIGYFMFDEAPDLLAIFGGTIILLSITYIAYRESVRNAEEDSAKTKIQSSSSIGMSPWRSLIENLQA